MRLVLLGTPGVGKGTQAEKLSKEFNLQWTSTGNILRDSIKDEDDIGNKVKPYVDKGLLVPDNVILETVKEKLVSNKSKNGFVLDGFPRTVPQAKALRQLVGKIDKALYLKCDEDCIVRRLSARRVCLSCGATYNLLTSPPKDDEICDKCNSKLISRSDDDEETIRERLRVHERQTADLKEFYAKEGILYEIDGSLSATQVYKEIKKIL